MNVISYQLMIWLLNAGAYYFYGNIGLGIAAFISFAGSQEIHRIDIKLLQYVSLGSSVYVCLHWAEYLDRASTWLGVNLTGWSAEVAVVAYGVMFVVGAFVGSFFRRYDPDYMFYDAPIRV